jgi:predicted dehydrogenase
MCCYYPMRSNENPPVQPVPAYFDYEMWTGPAPLRPFDGMPHRKWRSFIEYGNGIVGDMCVHMFDMTRWMLDLGWPTRIASTGGILVDKQSKANITDTQTVMFEYPDVRVVWQHRSWGEPVDPKYQWGATFYGDKGTLKVGVYSYDFTPLGGGQPVHQDHLNELDKYPEDKTEKELEKHVAPAIRRHMQNFLANIDSRGRPVSDIEQGYISTASCILANMSMKLGRELTWDAQKQEVVNDSEANQLLRRPYRQPWTHPEA